MLDARRKVVWTSVRLSGGQVEVLRAGVGVVIEVRVHARHFSCVRAHAASSLAGLDVSPDHGGHVALVVHEAGVEVGCVVWVCGCDVRGTAGEGVFLVFLATV